MTRYFYDTEFFEDGRVIDLISIGIVCEDGREYYGVNSEMPVEKILHNPWLKNNVWPHLPLHGYKPSPQMNAAQVSDGRLDTDDIRVKPKWVIRNEVREFLLAAPNVELWADYAAYDHVVLCQFWGSMVRLPDGLPMFTNDIQQEATRLGLSDADLPPQDDELHNALADARGTRDRFEFLRARQEA